MNKFYVTTAIDYVNAAPHIGHAYQKIVADVLARWNKVLGKKVFFLTGTDEHGKKIAESAQKNNKTPKEFVDEISQKFVTSWQALNLDFDRFIRTTDEDHKKTVLEFVKKIEESGDIYKGKYSGWYCVGCERYYTETEMPDKVCPFHKKPLEEVSEDAYFFRLSKYQDFLLGLYEKNPEFILPVERKNEMVNRVKEGLQDLCITRASLDWGIPFPLDKSHVIYVWFDALINYYTAINSDDKKIFWPADVHLLGKDNGWFHAIIWPAMLKSVGIEMPKNVFIHGFLTFNGNKISKSLGNVISPLVLADKYGADPIRYYCLRQIPFGEDGDFSEEALVNRHNSELADTLGNLVNRVIVLTEKNFDGLVPQKGEDDNLSKLALETVEKTRKALDNFQFNVALNDIFYFLGEANKYINDNEIWAIKDKEKLGNMMYNLLEAIRFSSILLYPFIPETSEKITEQLGLEKKFCFDDLKWGLLKTGTKTKRGKVLFQKIKC
ncbi:MAG: methionine--tRNA ligase [Candidatus Aenigmarchaeota archaeon]|nr:methionine--tRNA ligase [Candidatus Aenigmarchaeota archaeon]